MTLARDLWFQSWGRFPAPKREHVLQLKQRVPQKTAPNQEPEEVNLASNFSLLSGANIVAMAPPVAAQLSNPGEISSAIEP